MSAPEGQSGRAAGGQLEERHDLSAETTEKIQEATQLVEGSKSELTNALALLAAMEKRCRMGNDTVSLVRVCEASLKLCHQAGDAESLVNTLKTLASRRSQKSKAVAALVQVAMPWVLQSADGIGIPVAAANAQAKADRDSLVAALRDITDGKLFLEAERARLTRALATIKEEDGDIAGAADALQEVHVETYGALSKREKVAFILEQMRLTLAKGDYVRAAIVSNKINRKFLSEEGMDAEKVAFFELLTKYHRHDKDAFLLAQDYHAIYLTPTVQADYSKWKAALESTVTFLALSPYSMEQQDMLHRVSMDSNLEKLEPFRATIDLLLKQEIAPYPIPNQAEVEAKMGGGDDPALADYWRSLLHTRVNQHNIRVASKYYRRIHGSRLAELLGLTVAQLEAEISSMVSDHNADIYAKMDRPKDIIRFASNKSAETTLTDWADDISELLDLVEKTTHLIHKEMTTVVTAQ